MLDSFDLNLISNEFPLLKREVHGKPIIYLDNAATTQKPNFVIEKLKQFYIENNSNVHRASHYVSDIATLEFEAARDKVKRLINSPTREQIIWTKGTTESINLVASSWGRKNLKKGDEIILTELEHHSNIVPWQIIAMETGAIIKVIPVDENGNLQLDVFNSLLNPKVKLIAITHASNVTGCKNNIKAIIKLARKQNVTILVDGAQAIAHCKVDVQDLDCDFYVFSGHKMYGPTGIGVLWGKKEILNAMPVYQAGGEMIDKVSFTETTFNVLPYRFEAGTPNIAGAIGLGYAVDFLSQFTFEQIEKHETELLKYALEKLNSISEFIRIANPENSLGIISFHIKGLHPSDVGMLLDQQGIAIRTGNHCAQPLMESLNINGTARVSFAIYNNYKDVDVLYKSLLKVIQLSQ